MIVGKAEAQECPDLQMRTGVGGGGGAVLGKCRVVFPGSPKVPLQTAILHVLPLGVHLDLESIPVSDMAMLVVNSNGSGSENESARQQGAVGTLANRSVFFACKH
jgi:hypothetical protein